LVEWSVVKSTSNHVDILLPFVCGSFCTDRPKI